VEEHRLIQNCHIGNAASPLLILWPYACLYYCYFIIRCAPAMPANQVLYLAAFVRVWLSVWPCENWKKNCWREIDV